MADLAAMSAGLDPRAVAQVKQQYEGALLKALGEKEKKMDEQMVKLEAMDEDDFEKLREKRKVQMQKQSVLRQKNVLNGHGRYMELSDQKEFFDASKNSKMVVCHFFRASTLRCQYIDRHLGDLAPAHLETRFVKIDAEKSPFLVERLNIVVLPSILCIKDGKTEHTIVGFDEMGGDDEFTAQTLAYVLSEHKVLKYDGPAPEDADEETVNVLCPAPPPAPPPPPPPSFSCIFSLIMFCARAFITTIFNTATFPSSEIDVHSLATENSTHTTFRLSLVDEPCTQGVVMPKGANSIDMRRPGKGAIREGGAQAREEGDEDDGYPESDDDVDAYLEGFEESTADVDLPSASGN
eukprot:CAMPEP_0171842216 /NCGR_PEP_ID=MMETSP0992-20121227/15060_1 /TAXON_ID=483369 /ORGANISM="non described non described, Strain CCMP2098" /LENGTH=350 /DNA_ID=CAMNT_0012459415 /DNA_START=46 /DNA_END=1099 /DNA_ORIENTATION=-